MAIFKGILSLIFIIAPIYAFVVIIERFNRIELHMKNLETKIDQLLEGQAVDETV